MRYQQIIREGAIDTSAIALAADKLLYETFLKIIKDEAKKLIFSYDYDQKKFDKSYTPDDMSLDERASAIWEHARKKWEDRNSGAYNCIYTASKELTKLVQHTILAEYGVSLKQDGENDGVLIDQVYYPIDNVRVTIQHAHGGEKKAEAGLMHRRTPASTFSVPYGHDNKEYPKYAGLTVYIDDYTTDDFKRNYQDGVLSQIWFDITATPTEDLEGVDYAIDQMVGDIVPVFTHEFDHVLFYLKKPKHTKYTSRTMLPNKVSGRSYENHIDVNDPASYARYLASDIELQAWASDEAITLIRRMMTRQRSYNTNYDPRLMRDPAVWNAAVDSIIAQVKNPPKRWIAHSHQYQERIRAKAQGDEAIYREIWQRYLKLLIAKLLHYKK